MPQVQRFIAPYAQPVLHGELGLTSVDIANVLKVRHDNVTKKLNRIEPKRLAKFGFNFTPHGVKLSDGAGRPHNLYVMDIDTAKFVVAKWDNDKGWAYLRYLLDCERMILEGIPKLKEAFEKLEKEYIKTLNERNAYKRAAEAKKRRGSKLVDVISYPIEVSTLFGPQLEIRYEKIPYDELTLQQRKEARLRHNVKVQKGLAKSIETDLNAEHEKTLRKLKSSASHAMPYNGEIIH